MIAIEGLSYNYLTNPPSRVGEIVFPDFRVARGKQFLLLGNSGSGKTTLLHLLGGLLRSQSGKIVVEGVDITQLSEAQLDRFRGKQIGFIFQKNHLINSLSVKDNLLMAPFLARKKQDVSRVDEVLEQLGLKEKRNSRIQDLSQGQAQRVAIARAIINKPSLVLADEPTSSLDDTHCYKVIDLLNKVTLENDAALIVATHDQRLKSRMRDQIYIDSV
jgi:ABC-type lipoprotein export system ATPase subunit